MKIHMKGWYKYSPFPSLKSLAWKIYSEGFIVWQNLKSRVIKGTYNKQYSYIPTTLEHED